MSLLRHRPLCLMAAVMVLTAVTGMLSGIPGRAVRVLDSIREQTGVPADLSGDFSVPVRIRGRITACAESGFSRRLTLDNVLLCFPAERQNPSVTQPVRTDLKNTLYNSATHDTSGLYNSAALLTASPVSRKPDITEKNDTTEITDTRACVHAAGAARGSSDTDGFLKLPGDLQVYAYVDGRWDELTAGTTVLAEGTACSFERSTNPGQYDARGAAFRGGRLFQVRDTVILSSVPHRGLLWLRMEIRQRTAAALERLMGAENAGILRAMLTGDREGLSEEMRTLFSEGGISHILAVSGLHMSLIGMGIFRLLRKKRGSIRSACLFSGLFISGYVFLTGGSVSSIRAMVMFCLWLGSQLLGRTEDALCSISAAALVLLLTEPSLVFEPSFLLSFSAVLGIRLLGPAVISLLPGRLSFMQGACMSGAVIAATLPVVCRFYFQVTPYACLVNLLVVPMIPLMMGFSAAAVLLSQLLPAAGQLLAGPCICLLTFCKAICRLHELLPGHLLVTGCPALWQCALYSAGLVLLCGYLNKEKPGRNQMDTGRRNRRRTVRRKRITAVLAFPVLLFFLLIRAPERSFVHFIDVGQGDSILIRDGHKVFLVDAGSSTADRVWTYRISPTLKYFGISRIDTVFLTHGDSDHVSGIREYLDSMSAGILPGLSPAGTHGIRIASLAVSAEGFGKDSALGRLCAAAEAKGIPVIRLGCGDRIRAGRITLTDVFPDRANISDDVNLNSLVLLLQTGDGSVLLTGDLELDGERRLTEKLKEAGLKGITLLKAGHHGSRNASSTDFLNAVRPAAAVISCGRNNSYGHPHTETLERFKEAGTALYRTDADGAVTIRLRRGKALAAVYGR